MDPYILFWFIAVLVVLVVVTTVGVAMSLEKGTFPTSDPPLKLDGDTLSARNQWEDIAGMAYITKTRRGNDIVSVDALTLMTMHEYIRDLESVAQVTSNFLENMTPENLRLLENALRELEKHEI